MKVNLKKTELEKVKRQSGLMGRGSKRPELRTGLQNPNKPQPNEMGAIGEGKRELKREVRRIEPEQKVVTKYAEIFHSSNNTQEV